MNIVLIEAIFQPVIITAALWRYKAVKDRFLLFIATAQTLFFLLLVTDTTSLLMNLAARAQIMQAKINWPMILAFVLPDLPPLILIIGMFDYSRSAGRRKAEFGKQ